MVYATPSGFPPTRPMLDAARRPRGAGVVALGITDRQLWWVEVGLAIVAAVAVPSWLALAPAPTAAVSGPAPACAIASPSPDAAPTGRHGAVAIKGHGVRTH